MSRANGSSKPEKAAGTSRERHPGRLRAALAVLLGERLVPLQIHAEWAEYQMAFDDLLKRLSAQLARQAKAERARVERLLEAEAVPSPSLESQGFGPTSHPKAELYRRAAQARPSPLPRPEVLSAMTHHPEAPE